ncbi:cytochrome P450 [Hymenopellis radicata]|nr:cytochrome P450 [Hymenopellis radicata]
MIQFPHIQAKAQAEIDAVIGNDRLPTFEDRDSLVYVEALVREVLRWHGPFPLGVPHSSTEDDVYNGYFIPKGTTIIYNQWWALVRVILKKDLLIIFRERSDLVHEGGVEGCARSTLATDFAHRDVPIRVNLLCFPLTWFHHWAPLMWLFLRYH